MTKAKPAKKRVVSRAIATAIIVDPFGAMDKDGDDEIADHVETFSKMLAPHRLVVSMPKYVDDAKLRADLVIFDFGGMSIGNDLMADNSRRLLRWAQDHPSSLIVVASTFTYAQGLEPEMRELGLIPDDGTRPTSTFADPDKVAPPLPNMLVYTGYSPEKEKAIRGWFA